MKFKDVATFYTVWLVGPNGERESLGSSGRKSGSGLRAILWTPAVQARVKQFNGVEELRMESKADRLLFSNGWRIEFGGTIRQESACPPPASGR